MRAVRESWQRLVRRRDKPEDASATPTPRPPAPPDGRPRIPCNPPVLAVLVLSFHHSKGPIVEHVIPHAVSEMGDTLGQDLLCDHGSRTPHRRPPAAASGAASDSAGDLHIMSSSLGSPTGSPGSLQSSAGGSAFDRRVQLQLPSQPMSLDACSSWVDALAGPPFWPIGVSKVPRELEGALADSASDPLTTLDRAACQSPVGLALRLIDLVAAIPLVPFLALPDGAHRRASDSVYFQLPTASGRPLFGISCCRRISSDALMHLDPDVTRSHIQKSVCVISQVPAFTFIHARLAQATFHYFEQRDFRHTGVLERLWEQLNDAPSIASSLTISARNFMSPRPAPTITNPFSNVSMSLWESLSEMAALTGSTLTDLSPHDLLDHEKPSPFSVMKPKHILLLIKAILLEARVLVFCRDAAAVSALVLALSSLLPSGSAHGIATFGLLFDCNTVAHCKRFGTPLDCWSSKCVNMPYVSLQMLGELEKCRGFLLGASNKIMLTAAVLKTDLVYSIDPENGSTEMDIRNKMLQLRLECSAYEHKFIRRRLTPLLPLDRSNPAFAGESLEELRHMTSPAESDISSSPLNEVSCASDDSSVGNMSSALPSSVPRPTTVSRPLEDFTSPSETRSKSRQRRFSFGESGVALSKRRHEPSESRATRLDVLMRRMQPLVHGLRLSNSKEPSEKPVLSRGGPSRPRLLGSVKPRLPRGFAACNLEDLSLLLEDVVAMSPMLTQGSVTSRDIAGNSREDVLSGSQSARGIERHNLIETEESSPTSDDDVGDLVRREIQTFLELLLRVMAFAAGPERSVGAAKRVIESKLVGTGNFSPTFLKAWVETHNLQRWLTTHQLPTIPIYLEAPACGWGRFVFPNGDVYSGQFQKCLRHGHGLYHSVSGLSYEGLWANDKRHGIGTFKHAESSYCYTGGWKEDVKDGSGILISKRERYAGGFKNNKFEGHGVYTDAWNTQYEGNFENGLFHGKGRLTLANLEEYDGWWEQGKFHGPGKRLLMGDRILRATFEEGIAIGRGQMTFEDGSVYDGGWLEGKRHGPGLFHFVVPTHDLSNHDVRADIWNPLEVRHVTLEGVWRADFPCRHSEWRIHFSVTGSVYKGAIALYAANIRAHNAQTTPTGSTGRRSFVVTSFSRGESTDGQIVCSAHTQHPHPVHLSRAGDQRRGSGANSIRPKTEPLWPDGYTCQCPLALRCPLVLPHGRGTYFLSPEGPSTPTPETADKTQGRIRLPTDETILSEDDSSQRTCASPTARRTGFLKSLRRRSSLSGSQAINGFWSHGNLVTSGSLRAEEFWSELIDLTPNFFSSQPSNVPTNQVL